MRTQGRSARPPGPSCTGRPSMAVITHGPRELRTCGRPPRKDVPHSRSAEGLREGPGTAASWLRPRTRPAPETSGSCQRDLPAPAWDTGVRGPVRGECRPPRLTHRFCAVLTRRVPQTTRRGRGYNYCPCFPDEETGWKVRKHGQGHPGPVATLGSAAAAGSLGRARRGRGRGREGRVMAPPPRAGHTTPPRGLRESGPLCPSCS